MCLHSFSLQASFSSFFTWYSNEVPAPSFTTCFPLAIQVFISQMQSCWPNLPQFHRLSRNLRSLDRWFFRRSRGSTCFFLFLFFYPFLILSISCLLQFGICGCPVTCHWLCLLISVFVCIMLCYYSFSCPRLLRPEMWSILYSMLLCSVGLCGIFRFIFWNLLARTKLSSLCGFS